MMTNRTVDKITKVLEGEVAEAEKALAVLASQQVFGGNTEKTNE